MANRDVVAIGSLERLYGPWPIKHMLFKHRDERLQRAKFMFAAGFIDRDEVKHYWTDTVEQIGKNPVDAKIGFSTDIRLAAMFELPTDPLEAFYLRAKPFFRSNLNSEILTRSIDGSIRVFQFNVSQQNPAQ